MAKNNKKLPVHGSSTTWMKNVIKSLGYTTAEEVKSIMPGLTDTARSGMSFVTSAKELRDHIKEAKGMDRLEVIMQGSSKYVEAAKQIRKNAIEDLKSGNLNNLERGSDSGEFDFGFDDDFDFEADFGDDGSGEDFDESKFEPTINITSNINKNNPMVKAVEESTDTSIAIAKDAANRELAISDAHMMLSSRLADKISGDLATINDNLGSMVKFNEEVMGNYASTSLSFYESSLSLMSVMAEEIKRLNPAQQPKEERRTPFSMDDLFSYEGGFDIETYFQQVKKNIKSAVNSSTFGSMGSMLLGDEMLNMITNNPLGFLMGMVVKLPQGLTDIMQRFDNSISAFIPALMNKFVDMANDDSNPGDFVSDLKRTIFKVLGVQGAVDEKITLSNYERGAVPFDGMVRKSIIEVIPGYLSKILASVSEKQPITFDWAGGQFRNVEEMKREFYDKAKRQTLFEFDAYGDVLDEAKKYADEKYKDDPEAHAKFLRSIEVGFLKAARSTGTIQWRDRESLISKMFNSSADKNNPNIIANALSDDDLDWFQDIIGHSDIFTDASRQRTFAGYDKMAAREAYTKLVRRLLEENPNLAAILGNRLYDDLDISDQGGGPGGGPTGGHDLTPEEEARLETLKQLIRDRKLTSVPHEYEDLKNKLDYDAQRLLRQNARDAKRNRRFSLFGGDDDNKNPITKFLNEVLQGPMDVLNTTVDTIGKTLHDIIFGPDESVDEDGNEKKSIFERIEITIRRYYDKAKNFLFSEESSKEGLFVRIQNSELFKMLTDKSKMYVDKASSYLFGAKGEDGLYSGGLISDVKNTLVGYKDAFTGYFTQEGGVFDKIKSSFSTIKDTVTQAFNDAFYGDDPDYVPGQQSLDKSISVSQIIKGAGGVLKEGFQHFTDLIFGPKQYADGSQNKKYVDMDKMLGFVKENAPQALANGIIGAGTAAFLSSTASGLLSGLVLGPVGGAAVGIGGTLLMKSKTFTDFMFGHEDANTGKHIEGLISKKTQEWFKSNKGALIGGGIGGGILGSMGITALSSSLGIGVLPAFALGGPITGALLGIAGALAVKSNSFQEMLFGKKDESGQVLKKGLIDNITSSFAGNSDPATKRLLAGTASVGALGGIGLFGLIGLNPVLGAFVGIGSGLLAASEGFSEKIFGTPDENGKRHGGLLRDSVSKVVDSAVKPIMLSAKSAMTYVGNWFDRGFKEPIIEIAEYSFEGIKAAGASLVEKLSSTAIDGWLGRVGDTIVNAFTGLGKGLLKFGKSMLKTTGKLVLNSISAPLRVYAWAARGVAKNFVDSDTWERLESGRLGRLAEIKERREERNRELEDYKNKLASTDILSRFGDSMSERDATRAIKEKYGNAYNKLSSVEKANIRREEAVGQDVHNISDTTEDIKTSLETIIKLMLNPDDPDVIPEGADVEAAFSDNKMKGSIHTQTSDVVGVDDQDGIKFKGDMLSSFLKEAKPAMASDGDDGQMSLFDDAEPSPPPVADLTPNGTFEQKIEDKTSPSSILKSNGKVDQDKLSPDENPEVAQNAEGFKAGLLGALTQKGGALSAIIPVFGKLQLILQAVTVALPFIPLIMYGVYKLFSDPINTLKSVFEFLGGIITKSVKAAMNFFHTDTADKTEQFLESASTTNELIKSSNGATLKVEKTMSELKSSFDAELDNEETALGKGGWSRFFSNEGFYNGYASDYETKIRHAEYKETAQNLLKAHDLGTISLTSKEIEEYKKWAEIPDESLKITASEKFKHTMGETFDIGEMVSVGSTGIIGTAASISAKSSAIGEPNVEENSRYLLHKDEGVLTATANHMFGGAETTAGILNAYARQNMGEKDVSALTSIIGGTLNTPKQQPAYNGSNLLNMMAVDQSDMNELVEFITDTREGSRTVSDDDYWKIDDVSARKFGGFGEALFKMVRFVNYPVRLMDTALSGVADDISVYEGKLSSEVNDESVISKIKNALVNGFNSVTKFFSNVGSTVSDAISGVGSFATTAATGIGVGASTILSKTKEMFTSAFSAITGKSTGDGADTEGAKKSEHGEFESSDDPMMTKKADDRSGGDPTPDNRLYINKITRNRPITSKISYDNSGAIGGSDTSPSKIDIGMVGTEYYKFPSSSIPVSDINQDRVFSNGTHSKHWGLDLLVRDRSNPVIRSTTYGKVMYAGVSNSGINKSYGNMVQIQDQNGMYHLYGHLASLGIQTGDTVVPGTPLGIEGTTGDSSGNHLHYEVGTDWNKGGRLSGRVHPGEYMEGYNRGDKTITATPVESYVPGSYWDGTSSNRSLAVDNSGNTSSYGAPASSAGNSGGTILDRLYSPFAQFTSALKSFVTGEEEGVSADNFGYASSPLGTSLTTEQLEGADNKEKIWRYFRAAGYTPEGTAAIMGNMQAESGFNPINLENQYNSKWGLSDEEYTAQVDSGAYPQDRFNNDRGGYGLIQWTDQSRKPGLYNAAKTAGVSIGDLGMQLGHVITEFTENYPELDSMARNPAVPLYDTAKYMVRKYEVPQGWNTKAVWDKRAGFGQAIYDTYANAIGGSAEDTEPTTVTRNFKTPASATIAIKDSSDANAVLSAILNYIMQIASNTKLAACELSDIKVSQRKLVNKEPVIAPQATSDSASNSEMLDIASKRKRDMSSHSKQRYNVAKAIAKGF